MVDEDRVIRLLRRLEEDVRFLGGVAGRDRTTVRNDPILLAAVKYRFVTAIEGCAKVAHHLAASEGWPVAETNAAAVRELADAGVLDRELAVAVATAVGFRDLLVHQYADIDDARAVAHLDDLDDLRRFSEQVVLWMETRRR